MNSIALTAKKKLQLNTITTAYVCSVNASTVGRAIHVTHVIIIILLFNEVIFPHTWQCSSCLTVLTFLSLLHQC